MAEPQDMIEADACAGAPHPRHTPRLIGQEAAEAEFLAAWAAGRLHHAWLLCGPRGVGKATLAWRMARALLAPAGGLFGDRPPETLDWSPDTPDNRQISALAHPRLLLLRREVAERTGRLRGEIVVEQVRRLESFLGLSAADGGRRVVIVDAADELNRAAANALLKRLEEPPPQTVLILVSHAPSRLLPTIRSRCRRLDCAPLDDAALTEAVAQATGAPPDDTAQALAEGAPGRAIALMAEGGAALYRQILALLAKGRPIDRAAAAELAHAQAGAPGSGAVARVSEALQIALARILRHAAGRPRGTPLPGEAEAAAALAPSRAGMIALADCATELAARAAAAEAVNLDPAAVILDMLLQIDRTAARAVA